MENGLTKTLSLSKNVVEENPSEVKSKEKIEEGKEFKVTQQKVRKKVKNFNPIFDQPLTVNIKRVCDIIVSSNNMILDLTNNFNAKDWALRIMIKINKDRTLTIMIKINNDQYDTNHVFF